MIDGVRIKRLVVNIDERGRLFEVLRSDEPMFERFGQVYVTTVNPGYAKAWHFHKLQRDNFVCISGVLRVGLYDNRKSSRTFCEVQEIILDSRKPALISIPPEVHHGFESENSEEAVVINIPTEPYNQKEPDEYRMPFDSTDIPFKWKSKKGG